MAVLLTVFDGNGEAVRHITAASMEDALLNIADGETAVEGHHSRDTSYLDANGEVQQRPARAAGHEAWDRAASAWIDPRTPEDLAAEMQRRRQGASLTTTEFLEAAMAVNLLTPDEAAAAAWGEVPASFQPAVDQLSAEQKDRIRIIWPRVTIIERLDPFINTVAAVIGVSDETLDAMFGLTEYVP